MPQLRGDDTDQPQFQRRPMRRTGTQRAKGPPPVMDGGWVEISRLAQRLLTEELFDVSRHPFRVKTIEGRQEHRLPPPGDPVRQPTLGEQPQDVLVPQA